MLQRVVAVIALVPLALGLVAAPAVAAPEDELAARYAPIVRIVEHAEPCGPGEPYAPADVDGLLGRADVALRGPWQQDDLVSVAPTAQVLGEGLPGYHLDYPGDPLDAGCDFEAFSEAVTAGRPPTTYAHVVSDPAHPGELALQYWLFYVFNDFNNKHEGDWEMIQLVFPAATAAEALAVAPTRVGYSQHEGAEEASWTSSKLERDGDHPVVYPAAGSHANYFHPALFLGSSGAQGVGCDNTIGPHTQLSPAVRLIPTDAAAARAGFPWIAYDGHWGQREASFYNGPTGPSTKPQWTAPITWADEDWRATSFAVGGASFAGPTATHFFCGSVAAGSDLLTRVTANPLPVVIALAVLVVLLIRLLRRTSYRPTTPIRIERRRAIGQILTAAWRMYRREPWLFAGIGIVFVPAMLIATFLQTALLRGGTALAPLVDVGGTTGSLVIATAVVIGTAIALLALALLQVTTARAMQRLDLGEHVRVRESYREAATLAGALARTLLPIALAVIVLSLIPVLGLPLVIVALGYVALSAQVVAFEGLRGVAAVRRSIALTRGRWWRVATITIAAAGGALALGPVIGVALIFATDAPFDVINLISSLVYMVTMPYVGIATTYLFLDVRLRRADALASPPPDVLPAERVPGAAAALPGEA